MKKDNTDENMKKENKGIFIFAACAAVYLIVCGLLFVLSDAKMQSAYVRPVQTEPPAISDVAELPVSDRININTATAEELASISGIGEVTAQNIIEYREANNGFLDTEELMNVKGIGKKTYEKIKPYITV